MAERRLLEVGQCIGAEYMLWLSVWLVESGSHQASTPADIVLIHGNT
jgi:hypothetical protein